MRETRNSKKRTASSSSKAADTSKANATSSNVPKRSKRSGEKSSTAAVGKKSDRLKLAQKAVVDTSALPVEVICRILGYLALGERLRLAPVSRSWRQAVDVCLARHRRFPVDLLPDRRSVTNDLLEKFLSRLPGLRYLTGFRGTDLDVNVISRHCPQLEGANLSYFRVDVSSLERLCSSCPKLSVITLPDSCDEASIETVLRGLPELRSLDVDLSEATGRCLSLLPASLQELRVRGELKISSAQFSRLASCPALKVLDVTGVDWCEVPTTQLTELLVICPQLERLDARECDVSDVLMEQLPKKTPGIRHLNLAQCTELSEAALKRLGRLKELRALDLIDTNTTNAVLKQLNGASHLTKLAVGTQPYCGPDFTEEALARLAVSCPSLRYLLVTVMVGEEELVKRLVGQLSPDRDLTIFMHEGSLNDLGSEPFEDGPLHATTFSDWEDV